MKPPALLSPSIVILVIGLAGVVKARMPDSWIRGSVYDAQGAPLPGAQVYLPSLNTGALVDSAGHFRIGPLPSGAYELVARYIGYREVRLPAVAIAAGASVELEIVLIPVALEMEEIYVVPKPKSFSPEGVTARLSRKMIEDLPGAAQDIFIALQTLPGISSLGDDSKLYVRGGRPDENLIIYDGATIRSPFHFDFVGGGFNSIFNASLVENVSLHSGGFPARYGDRLSAVLVIENREGNRESVGGELSLSMADLTGLVEFPIGANGSSIVSLRRSYFDLLLDATGFGTEYTLMPYFYDLNAKLDYKLAARHRLSLSTLYSLEETSGYFDQTHWTGVHSWESSSATAGARLRSLWAANLSSEVDIYQSQSKRWAYHADGVGSERVRESELAFKADLAYTRPGHKFHAGLWIIGDRSDVRILLPLDLAPNFEPINLNGQGSTPKYAAYLEDTFTLNARDKLNLGLRLDAVGTSRETRISPRFGWVHMFNGNTAATLLLGLYTQSPAAYELDMNPDLKSKEAISIGIGLSGGKSEGLLWSVEAYYKALDHLVTITSDEGLESTGKGNVKGLETYVQYQDSRFTGWISLTLSRAMRREGTAPTAVLFDYDQTVIIAVVGQYRLGKTTTFGLRFRYTSGRPYTPAVGGYFDPDYERWFPIVGERNSERFPSYSRLDLRLSHSFPSILKGLTVYLETINSYNHKNVAFFIWEENFEGREQDFIIFPFLPILGIELKI